MLKFYGRQAHAGDSSEFWDGAWEGNAQKDEDAAIVRICEASPLHRIFETKVRPGRLFLDGGCGPAHWVRYYHRRGVPSVGIDFAARTVRRVSSIAPEVDLRVGDVRGMPLEDRSVHVYYSGGVVEHFEEGPEVALAEARRVVAPDGWFLCSVPDASWLRTRMLFRGRAGDAITEPHRIVLHLDATRPTEAPPGFRFHQYAFSEEEFRHRLQGAGFEVTQTIAMEVVWSFMESTRIKAAARAVSDIRARRAVRPATNARTSGSPAAAPKKPAVASNRPSQSARNGLSELVHRAFVREDFTAPVLGPAMKLVSRYAANMRMYVARPR